jgi:hypothetical protein
MVEIAALLLKTHFSLPRKGLRIAMCLKSHYSMGYTLFQQAKVHIKYGFPPNLWKSRFGNAESYKILLNSRPF